MAGRNHTSTIIEGENGRNKTGTHLSTNIVILVNGNAIGAITKLSVNEGRSIKLIDEVGTDGHIDSAPNKSVDIDGNCTRTRFDRMRIAEAFGRGFIHVHSQRLPFDIEIQDRFHDADPGNAIITVIKNVWIKKIGYQFSADDFVIVDDMDWVAEGISSTMNGISVVSGGKDAVGNPITIDAVESESDIGKYRGSLDSPGLLQIFG